MKYTKEIIIGIAAIILVGGSVIVGNPKGDVENPVVETSVDLTVEDKEDGVSLERWRIVPNLKVDFFPEESFTLNDIISEIEIEHSRNGESERYLRLLDLKQKVETKISETPN